MRVLVNALTAAPGGSISMLSTVLSEWPEGDDVLCLVWRDAMVEELRGRGVGVLHIEARSTSEALAKVSLRGRARIGSWSPDVVYSQQYFLPKLGVPQAVHHRNLLRFEPAGSQTPRERLQTLGAAWALRRADWTIFNSQYLESRALDRYPWLRSKRVSVVHNPIDPEAFGRLSPSSAAVPKRILVPQGDMPHKRNPLVVDVLRRLLDSRPDADLEVAFAGAGEYDDVRSYATEMGVDRRIRFLGYLARSEYAEVLAGSSLVLITSERESFCNPIVEAHAAGIPVVMPPLPIASEIAGPMSVVAHGFEDAHLAEAISRVLVSLPTFRARLAESREFAQTFHPHVMASKVRHILRTLAAAEHQ